MTTPLELEARSRLDAAAGPGAAAATASAPGRCTLVGDHVDYAGGLVLATAIDRRVAVAVRRGPHGRDRVAIDGAFVEHIPGSTPHPEGAGYVLAAAETLRGSGVDLPPFEAATAATLPPGAGLASSAAVICATLVALLRLCEMRVGAAELVDAAYRAEHDLLGVPSGRLDQHTIVETPEAGALLLDFATDTVTRVRWGIAGTALCVCDTGERHRVAGAGYRFRRAEAEAGLRAVGAAGAQDVAGVPLGHDVGARRVRHVVNETRLAAEAAEALRGGDAWRLGGLMSESHRSLRDDAEVSTAVLDGVVEAAAGVAGCYGARLVGAGFGGSVVALTAAEAAAACIGAMLDAAGEAASAWVVAPAAGLAVTAGPTVVGG